jgi:hypothetical protein
MRYEQSIQGGNEKHILVECWFSLSLSNTSEYFIIQVKCLKGLTFWRIWSKFVEVESGYEELL